MKSGVRGSSDDVPLADLIRRQVERLLSRLSPDAVEGLHPVVMREVERALILAVLAHTGGHRERTARILGLHRNTLRLRLASLGIQDAASPSTFRLRPRRRSPRG